MGVEQEGNMSGIYIPNMEMPTTCYDNCPCQSLHWCNVLKEITEPMTGKRIDNCPLVPVPPHGRLIDADALAEHKFVCIPHVVVNDKEAGVAYRLGWNTAIEAIMENAETVIGGE